jgi:hypothetical protein
MQDNQESSTPRNRQLGSMCTTAYRIGVLALLGIIAGQLNGRLESTVYTDSRYGFAATVDYNNPLPVLVSNTVPVNLQNAVYIDRNTPTFDVRVTNAGAWNVNWNWPREGVPVILKNEPGVHVESLPTSITIDHVREVMQILSIPDVSVGSMPAYPIEVRAVNP